MTNQIILINIYKYKTVILGFLYIYCLSLISVLQGVHFSLEVSDHWFINYSNVFY